MSPRPDNLLMPMAEALDRRTIDRNLELLEEGRKLVAAAEARGITMRLLGGVAVLAHGHGSLPEGGVREIADIDAAVAARQSRALAALLTGEGYAPESRFNALNGHRRMLFYGPLGQIDVLVGTFEMCHRFQLTPRLRLEHPTLTVSDLLLTKLQIVELNEKDARDALVLIGEHELGRKEGDLINLDYLDSMTRGDWGLWRTITGTLERLKEHADGHKVDRKIAEISRSLEEAPKTWRWKARGRLGERVRWYVLPDEVR